MIAQAQAKLLAVTKNEGKEKLTGKEFYWFKNDFLTPQGVCTLTSGKDYTGLVDKQVLISIDVQGKNDCKLVEVESFDTEPSIV